MLTFRHTPYGTSFIVLDDASGRSLLDTSVRPYLIEQNADLAPALTNYDRPFTLNDGNGKTVVWIEDGVTHVDDTGEIEVVESVAEALIARVGQ